jgi:hypothetical protein
MSDLADSDVHGGYADPVRRLLTIGRTNNAKPDKWIFYPARYGLGDEHVGALIQMALDPALLDGDPDTAEVWAPVHAWRTLGQLRAEVSAAPLLDLLRVPEVDDAAAGDLPVVFGMIGPSTLPLLAGFLADRTNSEYGLAVAASAVSTVGERAPACRDECVGILVPMLDPTGGIDPSTAGFVVSALLDLKAVEAIDAIRDAFARGAIEASVAGDLEDVEIELGLRDRRATRPNYGLLAAAMSSLTTADRSVPEVLPMADRFAPEVLPRRQEVGRNDPCPCGSGKKYKKCCL